MIKLSATFSLLTKSQIADLQRFKTLPKLESGSFQARHEEPAKLITGPLRLSTGRVAKYANHVCAFTKRCPFNPATARESDVEKVIMWTNGQPFKSSTKSDLRLVVKKLVQYTKNGSCDKRALISLGMFLFLIVKWLAPIALMAI